MLTGRDSSRLEKNKCLFIVQKEQGGLRNLQASQPHLNSSEVYGANNLGNNFQDYVYMKDVKVTMSSQHGITKGKLSLRKLI